MKKQIDLELLIKIASTSNTLLVLKEELERYYKEEYLNKTKDKHPSITVSIANHPTYLKDFTVGIRDDNLRDSIVKLAIQQTEISIKRLEKELAELLKQGEKE